MKKAAKVMGDDLTMDQLRVGGTFNWDTIQQEYNAQKASGKSGTEAGAYIASYFFGSE